MTWYQVLLLNVKDNLIVYKCFCYCRNYPKTFDGNLKKELIFLTKILINYFAVAKGVYLYEAMDDWETFYETLPDLVAEQFHSRWKILLVETSCTWKAFGKTLKL